MPHQSEKQLEKILIEQLGRLGFLSGNKMFKY